MDQDICRCGHYRVDHTERTAGHHFASIEPAKLCYCREYEPCDHDHPRTVVSAGGYGRCGNCGREFTEPSDEAKYGVSNADFY